MPLLPCSACGHAISRSALACPQCGHPQAPAAAAPDAAPNVAPPRADVAGEAPRACFRCGQQGAESTRYCSRCGLMFGSAATNSVPGVSFALPTPTGDADSILERIAEYERISAILWLVLGIIQVVSVVAIIAGIWNIIAAISRFKLPAMIRARDPAVPAAYEGVAQLIVLGVLNLFLGGAIGVLFVVFDFYVRSLVLQHRHLFEVATPAQPPPLPDA